MDSLEVKRDLLIKVESNFNEVDLHNANIGGQFEIKEANKFNNINMQSLEVKRNLFIGNNVFENQIDMSFIKINGNLDISMGRFPTINLTGAQILGELQLCLEKSQFTQWEKCAKFILTNTKVGTVKDLPESWPDNLELNGFTYTCMGGYSQDEALYNLAERDFIKWLGKQKGFSPQSYEQLANFLQKAGYKEKALKILYAGKERERKEVAKGKYWLYLTFLKYAIGYGYGHRIFRSLYWISFFTAVGSSIIWWLNKEGRKRGVFWCLFFSFDLLLPIIKLDDRHYKIELEGFAKYYFYIHKLIGFVLASFIVAGISGLIK